MALTHGLLQLLMLGITIWCYWKILGKAGLSGWWSFLLVISVVVTYLASAANSPIMLIAPYILPAAMIWIFAFIRWPSFDAVPAEADNRHLRSGLEPSPPSGDSHRRVNSKLPEGKRRRRRPK